MHRRAGRIGIFAALAVSLATAAIARAQEPTIPASVSATPAGRAMPSGFVGLSLEYKAVHLYTGRDPRTVNPTLLQLVRGLGPHPVLRIGGDSTDSTWWPIRAVIPRGGITYALNKGWLRTTRALADDLRAKLILGINLASDSPAIAAAESRALLQGIGRRDITALEIGNEPDLYGVFPWYRDRRGHVVWARGRHYGMTNFIKDFSRLRAVLPSIPLVGPSFSRLNWMSGLGHFLAKEHPVRTVTIHRYPLHNSTSDTSDPTYPSIPNLLADTASSGIANQLAGYVRSAHNRGLQFRVDEMNSVSGSGRAGVSDTFASALWILDTLFNMAAVGVDGVNVHTLPGAAYQPFTFTASGSNWQASVHPEYYGMLLFAQAFPAGARLLPVSIPSGPVKVWATTAPDGKTRVVLINKDTTTPVTVQLSLADSTRPLTVGRLTAPSVDATGAVTLDGQSFGTQTSTGTLAGQRSTETVDPAGGSYSIDLPAGSAALLTG